MVELKRMGEKKIFQNCIDLLADIYANEDNDEGKNTANFLLGADCSSINFTENQDSNLSTIFARGYVCLQTKLLGLRVCAPPTPSQPVGAAQQQPFFRIAVAP